MSHHRNIGLFPLIVFLPSEISPATLEKFAPLSRGDKLGVFIELVARL